MLTKNQAEQLINILMHILILSTFLTIIFFKYFSKIEKKTVRRSINSVISKNAPVILSEFDKQFKLDKDGWNKIDKDLERKKKLYIEDDPKFKKHNDVLYAKSMIAVFVVFIIFMCVTAYFVLYKKYNINFKQIIIESALVFLGVGIIEYLFFTNIALKYVPVNSDEIRNNMIDRVKMYIDNKLS